MFYASGDIYMGWVGRSVQTFSRHGFFETCNNSIHPTSYVVYVLHDPSLPLDVCKRDDAIFVVTASLRQAAEVFATESIGLPIFVSAFYLLLGFGCSLKDTDARWLPVWAQVVTFNWG